MQPLLSDNENSDIFFLVFPFSSEESIVKSDKDSDEIKPLKSDPDVDREYVNQLKSINDYSVLLYDEGLPQIQRAMEEKRVTRMVLDRPELPENGLKIARAIGASHVVYLTGTVLEDKVKIVVGIKSVSGDEGWTFADESIISQTRGVRKSILRQNAILTAAASGANRTVILALGQKEVLKAQRAKKSDAAEKPEIKVAKDPELEINAAIEKADDFIKEGRSSTAITVLKRGVDIDPFNVEIRIKLSDAYVQSGLLNEAISECERALLLNETSLSVRERLSKLYVLKGVPDKSLMIASEIVAIDPGNIEARLNLGDAYWNTGKVDLAEEQYKQAAAIDPSNPYPYDRLYSLYSAQKKYLQAYKQLTKYKLLSLSNDGSETRDYQITASVIKSECENLLGKLKQAEREKSQNLLTYEEYYSSIQDLLARSQALSEFVSGQTPPDGYRQAHGHAMLAVNLISQSANNVILNIQTGNKRYLDDSEILRSEALIEVQHLAKNANIP